MTWRMQNRDANLAVAVYIWMPHLRHKLHNWRIVWEVIREIKSCFEIATFEYRILWTLENNAPFEEIVIVL